MRRGFWFLAGAGAGVYAVTRTRRIAEALTPDGLRDRLAGLSLGAQLLGEDIRAEMELKEVELRERLRLDRPPEDTTYHRQLGPSRPLELTKEGNS